MPRVLYNGNANTAGSVPVDNTVYPVGANVTVLGNTGSLVKNSDPFASWNTVANGSGTLQLVSSMFVIGAADVTLFAQYYTTTGLNNGGTTTHYQFRYDPSLAAAGMEPARTNTLMTKCEADFTIMKNWFGGIELSYSYPISMLVANRGGGAAWGPPVTLMPGNGNADVMRDLMIAEITEMFMLAQNGGWFAPDGSNEQSSGEGLSLFLVHRFQILDGRPLNFPFNANSWLNSSLPTSDPASTRTGPAPANYDYGSRYDYVNNILEYDHSNSPAAGCSAMFLSYLLTQLGFTTSEIVQAAAPTIAGVYRNLTGDTGDPFPFFKLLAGNRFPENVASNIPGPDMDNPFPLALLSFWVDKSTFGRDEVQDIISTNGGRVENAFWLMLEGFNINTYNNFGTTISPFTGSFKTSIPGIQIVPNASAVEYETPSNPKLPQRIRLAFDIIFTNASLAAFPPPGSTTPSQKELDTSVTIGANVINGSQASTIFELVAGADPYFTNINPAADNVFWLSQDLRVFKVTPGQNNSPVGNVGTPPQLNPATNNNLDTAAGFQYIQNLLNYLNTNYSNPAGTDPFSLLPGQATALTGDSSVTPLTLDISNIFSPRLYTNYSFAIARVRMRGTAGAAGAAQNVKVFFRLWSTETADTDFNSANYPSTPDANGLPGAPLVGAGNHTMPFFATGNFSSNTDYIAAGINNRTIQINTGDFVWAYFGCYLNLYDGGNIINGQNIQNLLNGTHHCIVAEIAFDGAPIINANGIVKSPENSDKLAQRNLQITLSDNPGPAATHRIPQTFDLRPSKPLMALPGSLLNYPDELMIDWGGIPVDSTANIYWPQANISEVIKLADQLYSHHTLSASDSHTLHCNVTKGVSYIPIPIGSGQNFAGLFTVDLPTTITAGQEFNIVVRRITTRRIDDSQKTPGIMKAIPLQNPSPVRVEMERTSGPMPSEIMLMLASNSSKNWRYVTGTFQVKIPVTTKEIMLWPEQNTLAIMKARLQAMSPANRWYPVLQRYIQYISGRVDGLGGNSESIKPSYQGYIPAVPSKEPCRDENRKPIFGDKCCKPIIWILTVTIFLMFIIILILALRN